MSQSHEREPQSFGSVSLFPCNPVPGTKIKCSRETRDLKTAGFYLLGILMIAFLFFLFSYYVTLLYNFYKGNDVVYTTKTNFNTKTTIFSNFIYLANS